MKIYEREVYALKGDVMVICLGVYRGVCLNAFVCACIRISLGMVVEEDRGERIRLVCHCESTVYVQCTMLMPMSEYSLCAKVIESY